MYLTCGRGILNLHPTLFLDFSPSQGDETGDEGCGVTVTPTDMTGMPGRTEKRKEGMGFK